jgi:hypothetical protein
VRCQGNRQENKNAEKNHAYDRETNTHSLFIRFSVVFMLFKTHANFYRLTKVISQMFFRIKAEMANDKTDTARCVVGYYHALLAGLLLIGRGGGIVTNEDNAGRPAPCC